MLVVAAVGAAFFHLGGAVVAAAASVSVGAAGEARRTSKGAIEQMLKLSAELRLGLGLLVLWLRAWWC